MAAANLNAGARRVGGALLGGPGGMAVDCRPFARAGSAQLAAGPCCSLRLVGPPHWYDTQGQGPSCCVGRVHRSCSPIATCSSLPAQGGGAGRERIVGFFASRLFDLSPRPGWRPGSCRRLPRALVLKPRRRLDTRIVALLGGTARFIMRRAGGPRCGHELRRPSGLEPGQDDVASAGGTRTMLLVVFTVSLLGRLDPDDTPSSVANFMQGPDVRRAGGVARDGAGRTA
jgi:hypothetical protein